MAKVVCHVRIEVPGSMDDAMQAGFQFGQRGVTLKKFAPMKKAKDAPEDADPPGHVISGTVSFDKEDETEQTAPGVDTKEAA